MKHTIRWVALLLAGAAIFAFAACKGVSDNFETETTGPSAATQGFTFEMPSAQTVAADPDAWSLTIRGGQISEFTKADAKYLQLYQNVPMTMTDTNYGVTITRQYTGVTLKSIMEFVGVPPSKVSSVNVTSANGRSVNYSAALALDEGTLLAWEEDGSPIQGYPPLKMCAKSGSLENYVDLCSVIEIIQLGPGQTLPYYIEETTLPIMPSNYVEPYYPPYTYPIYTLPPYTQPKTTLPTYTLPTLPTATSGSTLYTGSGAILPTATDTTGITGSTDTTGSTASTASTAPTVPTTVPAATTKPNFTYSAPVATTKAPTTASVPTTESTTQRTTHTFPDYVNTPERKKDYDLANGLVPNYPPDY